VPAGRRGRGGRVCSRLQRGAWRWVCVPCGLAALAHHLSLLVLEWCSPAATAPRRLPAAASTFAPRPQGVPPEEAGLAAEHARCAAVAAAAFDDAAVGDAATRASHQHKMQAACSARCVCGCVWVCVGAQQGVCTALGVGVHAWSRRLDAATPRTAPDRFAQVRARKLAEAATAVSELLLRGSVLVNDALADAHATPDRVQEQLQQFVGEFTAAAAGPAKWPRLLEFLMSTHPRITATLVQRQQAQVRVLFACVCVCACVCMCVHARACACMRVGGPVWCCMHRLPSRWAHVLPTHCTHRPRRMWGA
jgi:hypothetical protein